MHTLIDKQHPELDAVIDNRSWLKRHTPFPHIIALRVFKARFYEQLEASFRSIMAQGYGDSPYQLTRRMTNYDAYSINLGPDLSGPLSIFISPAWHNVLTKITGVKTTKHINATIHHHAVGSANGRVHTDLNPAWFIDSASSDSVQIAQHGLCNYKYGNVSNESLRVRELVRAVTMLFYFSNPGWIQGDGGETGLYRTREDFVDRPVATLPPINNSLLVFECTPYSYHCFLHNRRSSRNSVIIWLHREKSEVVSRWGASCLEHWPQPNTSLSSNDSAGV